MTIQPARRRRRGRSWLSAAAATLIVISGSPGVAVAQAGAAEAAQPGQALVTNPDSFVDPFIGTTGGANESPGAQAPFGMVAWGPDTPNGGDGSGYNFGDATIDGFSVLHLPTVGCHATGDIPLLPEVGTSVNPSGTETIKSGSQHASPGYYSVRATDGVKTQLTATQRTGLAQFTFPQTSTEDNLILKMSGDGANGLVHPSAFSVNAISSTEVQGSVTSGDFCSSGNRYQVFFDMQFSAPFTSTTFAGPALRAGARRLAMRAAGATRPRIVSPSQPEGANHPVFHGQAPRSAPALSQPGGMSLSFGPLGSSSLLVRVGLSFTSVAEAQANLTAEQHVQAQGAGDGFATVRAATAGAWQSLLGELQVSGGDTGKDTVFYTALYHALSFPSVFSDADGAYRGMDGQTHAVPTGHAFYTNFSGWDIYRTQAQLVALLDPSAASDMAQSMVDDYQQGGELPKWVEYNGETHIMVGDPADPILADYYAFGATGFDTTAALQAMVAQASYATLNRPGLNYLSSPGYLPLDGVYCRDCNYYAPASSTLEYAAADFAVSAFASDLGQSATAKTFLTRAQNWQNLLNPGTGLLQSRTANGAWAVDRRKPDLGFAEASPWQYTGMVPFNVAGLAAAKGGDAAMIGYLNHVLSGFRGGKSSIANLGNEPSIELPWEYDYVGQPYQTQSKVRQIINQIWKAKPNGLAGNDDLGTMSAWLVWAALGLYPMTPGTPTLALGSPLFAHAVITLPGSATLTIDATGATRTDGTTEGTPYVQSATWQPAGGPLAQWNAAYAPTGAITTGGTLTFAMSATPNTSWAAASPPPSYSAPPPDPRAGAVVSSVGTDECLDDAGSGTANGNKIDIFRCNGSAAQLWQFRPNETIRVLGKCLSPARRSHANGVPVVLSACHGASVWQHWRARANGTLINLGSRECLGDPGSSTANRTQVKTWACRKGSNQRWRVPYSSPPPPAGPITSALASQCLDLANGQTKRGAAAVIEPCDGAATQQWTVETDGTIHGARGRCLDVTHGGTAPGTLIDYFTCNNRGAQQWRPQPDGTLVNPNSGLCLDLPATTNGTQLTLATCVSGSAGEQWKLP